MNKAENCTLFDTDNSIKKTIIFLSIIGVVGLSIRLIFFSYEVPITLDAITYFLHATDAIVLSGFPDTALANNGWSLFLALFFGITKSNNLLVNSSIQQLLSISLSVLTIIPIYLICKKFVRNEFAILAAGIYVFEPRIIQNSVLGITEPLYIILGSISLLFFLNNKITYSFVAFGFIAITSMVRAESLFLIIPFSIMFFIKFKTEKKVILKYFIALSIFILILLPMSLYKMDVRDGDDAIFGRVTSSINDSTINYETNPLGFFKNIEESTVRFIQFIGWIQIPIFVMFFPIGLILIFKNRTLNNWTLILTILFMLIPIFYGISKGPDTRYLYFIYPMLCVISAIGIDRIIGKKIPTRNYSILILSIVLVLSLIFLSMKMSDLEYEKNAMGVGRFLEKNASGVNDFHPEASYIKPAIIESEGYPKLAKEYDFYKIKKFPVDTNSIEKFISNHKSDGLSHLVIDKNNQIKFLKDIFDNEKDYPYLIKELDSSDYKMKYEVKIFRINFQEFNSKQN